ncbi:FAD-dependent oxidoreductase [Nocardia nova]|uniref:FAD-dependent oxidoreductase n=1 Tax=Nocardia nova TaxID=37330 RepID=A0A2S6AQU5_9NOCA|nr:FAD-dependent oxidoreductase [Nocardia nova]PPJ27310.1 FAD-dependent oxidoreductase [Nocardia nova]PPJ37657.1 FAD-dependent oxidoreductase [Nocardia nova]
MTGRVVVVGAGVAGATAARTLRTEGYTGEIVLLGAEDRLPYRRPMVSKELLAGTANERRLLLESADSWRELDIEVRPGTPVEGIDVERDRLQLGTGEVLGYDALVLATGARARELPGPESGAYTLRTAADADTLRAAVVAGGSLLVVGGGLVGCEAAATARVLGAAVTLVHAGDAPLERVAPAVIGAHCRNLHAGNGVDIHDAVVLDRIDGGAGDIRATAVDGRAWTAAAVLVAIGAEPETELARRAGLAVGDGILVDESYTTSAPNIFAAGDAAAVYDPEFRVHRRTEQWNSAQAHGIAVAKSVLGQSLPAEEITWGWTTQYGVTIQFAGRPHPEDDVVVRTTDTPSQFIALCLRAGRLVAAAAVGRPADLRTARHLIAARTTHAPETWSDTTIALQELATATELSGRR